MQELHGLGTPDCLGSCGTAPMLQIGFDYYENLTNAKVDEILDSLIQKEKRA